MQSETGIIVVSYHNANMTIKYVNQELPKLTVPYTLVVVNVDASIKESRKLASACNLCLVDEETNIQNGSHQGYLIWSQENLGYAKGNNLGVQFLEGLGINFDYFLFSNDDIEIVDSNVLEILAERMRLESNIACIGPRITGLDGKEQSPHDRYISPLRHMGWRIFPFLRRKKRSHPMQTTQRLNGRRTYWVCGAFMMVDAKRFTQIKGFDPYTFLYYEEVILSERLKAQGWECYYEPSVQVIHYEGSSTSGTPSKEKQKREMRSRLHYYRQYRKVSPITLFLYKLVCR